MSLSKLWFLALCLTLAACGGGGSDGGEGGEPDAAAPGRPDAGSPPGTPDASMGGVACESYCSAIMTNCTGSNAQYADVDECLELCGASGWSAGEAGAKDGNSLSCRSTHAAELAAADPDQHCATAGPTGNGVCGSLCESYCAFSGKYCSEQHAYRDEAQCVEACENLIPQDGEATAEDNSVQCRLRHLVEAARGGDVATECAAADVHGNDTCGSWCEVYCDLMETNCSDQRVAYADRATCLDACASFADDGDPEHDMGDTVQCRIYHAGVPAMLNAGLACGHAAESPTNYCIDVSPL